MAKKVFYDEDARQRMLAGAEILYKTVKTTMGPKGRNVVIGKGYGGPQVTHDGVSVAKSIDLPEDDETLGYKVGAELIKSAANKMNDVAGDGTTTVTVLTYHILNEANKLIAAGHNPMQLRKGLEQAASEVITELSGLAEDIKGKKSRVAEVGTISAGDTEIGNLIADVIEKVGKEGVVTVEPGQSLGLESEVVEGFTIDKGFVSAYMVSDTTRMEAVVDKPAVLVTDKKISSIQEFAPILEKIAQSGKKDIVIFSDEVEGEALTMLVLNKLKGVLNAVAVKPPSFGDRRKDVLLDIATLTGATVISSEHGMNFDTVDVDVIGSARKVIVTKDSTTIIEGAGTAANIKARIAQIEGQIASAAKYEKDPLQQRLASLTGKVAVIKVGGATETEINEKKDRVDDAVHAVKAALSEGIVPGGGVTLVYLASKVKVVGSDSIAAGRQLLKNALEQPFRILLENAGINPDEFLPLVRKGKGLTGVDVNNSVGEMIDLKPAGIIDPARVTKEAILNSSSIAGTAMTMGALVVDIPEKAAPAPDMGAMGGMM
jgi:chaperonin GroEL